MKKLLWLIRHGESEANSEGRVQGWLDYPLSDRGRAQAGRLSARLAGEGIARVLSSPLARASETARILAGALGMEVSFDDRLREYGFGPLAGLDRAEIAARHPEVARALGRNAVWEPLAGEEGRTAFARRVRAALDRAVEVLPEDGVGAVVAHAGVLNAGLRSWLSIADRGFRTFAFDNASLTLAEVGEPLPGAGRNLRLLFVNDTAHLAGLAAPSATWYAAGDPPGALS